MSYSVEEAPERFGFLLMPQFSLIAFAAAIETLRLANRSADAPLYEFCILGQHGESVQASGGFRIEVDAPLQDAAACHTVIVCGGIAVHQFEEREVLAALRQAQRSGRRLGALCTGSHVLARAGLLDGYRCTVHWENLASFSEDFPEIEVTGNLYEIDRNRFTCAGGSATADMMMTLVANKHGETLAREVAEQAIHERIRGPEERQQMSVPARFGVRHPRLLTVIELMENNLEEPLSRSDLAKAAQLSTRQLERLFRRYLERSPARYYLELRLRKARQLLLQTSMSVMQVAMACGFVSASHFTKCYRAYFGRTPYRERAAPQTAATPTPEAT